MPYLIIYKDGSSKYVDSIIKRAEMKHVKQVVPLEVVKIRRRERV